MTGEPPSAMLWERDAFDSLSRSIAFFRGAILGVAVLLTLSMLLLYTTRARASFLSGGIFALASVAFVAIEAGYFAQARKLFLGFEISPAEARAIIESLMSVGLLLCLTALADLRRTVPVLRNIFVGLALVGTALPVYAFVDPLLVSAIARIAFADYRNHRFHHSVSPASAPAGGISLAAVVHGHNLDIHGCDGRVFKRQQRLHFHRPCFSASSSFSFS